MLEKKQLPIAPCREARRKPPLVLELRFAHNLVLNIPPGVPKRRIGNLEAETLPGVPVIDERVTECNMAGVESVEVTLSLTEGVRDRIHLLPPQRDGARYPNLLKMGAHPE